MRKKNSFTLIEFLVVISVIGLLSSIILVSTKGTRDKARIAKGLEFSQSIQNALGAEAVGIWEFNEGLGATIFTDTSGNKNNGSCSGVSCPTAATNTPQAVLGQGAGKYALSFDGGDDYVDAGSAVPINNSNFTISAWVYPTNLTGDRGVVGRGGCGGHGSVLMFGLRNGNIFGSLCGGEYDTVGATTLTASQWYFITWVFISSNNTSYMYLNGASNGSHAIAGPYLSFQGVDIGRMNSSYFAGLIDEVHIYNQALSASEIQKHYAEGLERHKNLALQ